MQELKIVEICCPLSRSPIKSKKFRVKSTKRLTEMSDILSNIFELENFSTTFKFGYNSEEIHYISDIKEQEILNPINLTICFFGNQNANLT